MTADALSDLLWADHPPPSWQKVIQGCVVRLRKRLGGQAIETAADGYRLTVPLDEIDAQRFEHAVRRARELMTAEAPERAAIVLSGALELWRGPAFDDLEEWDVARVEVARLTELRYEAEELYVEASLRAGQLDRVLAMAQVLVSEAPLRERRWMLLATVQYQDGRQSEALRTIQRLKVLLDEELGLDPSPDVGLLEQAILRQDPALVAATTLPEPSPVCPFPGLRPYKVSDSDGFFGRDADTAACLRKLSDTSVLTVVGPSGCGKSSLVRAGVAAALRRDGRQVVLMTPGAHPMAALTSVRPAEERPVLVVDQCEETFSVCADPVEREAFLAALVAHSGSAPLILALRADRIADVSAYPRFARLVEPGLYLLGGMSEEDLRATIEQPAEQAGLLIEPGLVDLLVGEVADQPGALPLLSHALAETWRRREGRTLTVDGYTASGGIRGAVAQTAEQIYGQLRTDRRPVLRDLMLRLVAPGPDGDPVRSRLPRRLVVTGAENDAMIDLLTDARLVTSDDGVVELAHESLARAWPRLRDWLDENAEGQRILHHLAIAADTWNDLGRPDSELYRGVRLAKALDWQHTTETALTPTEEAFLAESRRLSEAELRAAEDRAGEQLRINRRLRFALVAGIVLLVGALVAGLVAADQAGRAEDAAKNELARQVGARAQLTKDVSASLLLAAHGVRLVDSAETRANLVAAVNNRPLLIRSIPSPSGRTNSLDVSPDGTRIVSGGNGGAVHLFDAESGRVVASYTIGTPSADRQVFTTARFSPDGRFVAAVAGYDSDAPVDWHHPLRLLSATTLQPVTTQPEYSWIEQLRVISLAFSADGRHLAAGVQEASSVAGEDDGDPAFGLVWDLQHLGQAPRRVTLPAGGQNVALSPDGGTIYVQDQLTAYDVATGELIWQQPTGGLFNLAISPKGDLLALQQVDDAWTDLTAVALVDASSGKLVRRLYKHTDIPRNVAFSSDGSQLATAAHNGDVIVWNVATGTPVQQLKTFEVSWAVGFSPDGRSLYTAGDEGIIRVYDLSGQRRYVRSTEGVTARTYAHVLPSPDGLRTAYLWAGDSDSWIAFSDSAGGAMTVPTRLGLDLEFEGRRWMPLAWHPDGHRLLVHDYDTIVVVDTRTGAVVVREGGFAVDAATYTEHGTRILLGVSSGTILLDSETLELMYSIFTFPADCCITASPDGETVILFEGSADFANQRWRVVQTQNGSVVSQGVLPLSLNYATYAPDGRRVAATGVNGDVFTIETDSGKVTRAPTTGHSAAGVVVGFSPDGSRIVSGAADGTVSVLDAQSLELLGTVTTPGGTRVAPTFANSNDIVRIAGADGRTYTWDTRIDHTLAYACVMAGRNLTQTEWAQTFGDRPYEKTCPATGG